MDQSNRKRVFALGQIVATPGALAALERLYGDEQERALTDLIDRHVSGDWSELVPGDRQQNVDAVATGDDRVFSAYTREGVKFWIITEWDRSVTTLLLPDEY